MTTETTKEELEWAFTNYKPNQRMVYSYVDRLYKKGKGIHINPNLPPNQKILIPKKGVGSYLVVLAKEDDEQGSEHENGIPEPSSPIPINDESRNDSHSDGSPKHSKTDKPKKQTKQNNSQQTSRSYSNEILTLKSAFLNGFKLMNIPKDEESDFGEDLSQLLEYVFDDQINMVQVTNCRSIVGKYELINSVTSSTVAHLNYILCKARRAYKAKLVKNKVANNRYEIQQLLDANVDGISNTLQAKEYIIALDKKVCKGAKIVDLVDLLFLGSKGTQILLLLVWKTSIPWSTFYNLCNEKISLLIECITEDVAAHTRIQAISKSPHDKDNDKGDESEEASDDDSVVESEISNESRMSRVESSNESREARVQTMNQYESKARVVYEDDNLGQDNFEKRSGEITQNRKSEFQSPIFSPLNVNMYEEGKENMQISNDFNVNTHASNVSLIGNSIEKTNKSIENTSNKSIEKTSNKQGHPNKRRIVLGQVDKSKIGNPGRKHLGSRPRSLKSIQK